MSRDQEFRNLFRRTPQLSSQLPIRFSDKLHWDKITINCSKCGQDLPDHAVHANVSSLIPAVITVEGVGICRDCLLLVPVFFRFRNDGSMEFIHHGRWVKTYGTPTSLIGKLRKWFKKHLIEV
jgi:hypothetical protein